MIGTWEFILIVSVILILFLVLGKKLPEFSRNAGRSVREFKEELKEVPRNINEVKEEIVK
jgi:TatA/E family protein of Tat protein translocase